MSHDEFVRIMAYLEAGSGTSTPMKSGQAEVYFDLLQHLPAEAVQRAAKLALAESQFPTIPPVGVILRLAGASPLSIRADNRALVAYGAAGRAVHSQGGYTSVEFDDPLANAAIRNMGGWQRFTEWPVDELAWRQRDFLQHYAALSAAGIAGELAAPLSGICDTSNAAAGFTECVEQPRRIECGLPPHPPGIVRSPVPDRRRLPAPAIVRQLARRLTIDPPKLGDDEGKPEAERAMPTAEEFAAKRDKQIARLRAHAAPPDDCLVEM